MNHSKVGVVFNIVDDKIEWIPKIYDPTEKSVYKKIPVYYSLVFFWRAAAGYDLIRITYRGERSLLIRE